MDVEMQMEANGLPTQFSSTSEHPEEAHVADNIAASIANNSESAVTAPPSIAPSKEVVPEPPLPEPVKNLDAPPIEAVAAPEATAVPEIATETTSLSVEAPAINGAGDQGSDPSAPPISSAIPDSQPQPSLTTTSISDSALTESVVPSSIPTEIPSSATPLDLSQPTIMDITDPVQPVEAPISDLRTEPHSDALAPEAVAQIEAQKHELDNSADLAAPINPDVSMNSVLSEPIVDAPFKNLGLPSPPAQTPPAAPQPSHASLPETQPSIELSSQPEPVAISASLPEEPIEPAPTPAAPQVEPLDHVMEDAPAQPTKQLHDREEDDDDTEEPAAKRMRTELPFANDDVPQFKVPDVPATSASPAPVNGDAPSGAFTAQDGNDSVTQPRLAHMKKVISNLKKSTASSAFRLPVDPVALKIPTYLNVIAHPMDLGTIDQRLKRNEYSSVSGFVADFEQIVINCATFNGPNHTVTQQARKMKSSFDSQMKNLPQASLEEPSKEAKKAAKKVEPTRSAPPRRPSVTTSTINVAPAASPVAQNSASTAFALNPDGLPLIRRDSSLADTRPKRAIIPTKRNADFGAARPRKKKYELQLKFCEETLRELMATKNWIANQYFMHPVDPVALNIPTYFQIIKKPMDLTTIQNNLQNNQYEKAKDFEDDVRQIIKNCFKFNPDGDLVNQAGHNFEALFNKKWEQKDGWISAREPSSAAVSDAEDDDDDDEDEESEDETNDSEDERAEAIKKLQAQIAEMSKQMGELTQKKPKKSKSPAAPSKSKKKKSKPEVSAAPIKASKDTKKDNKKKASKKPEKERFVTFAEKQYISNGIAMLPEQQMSAALRIIQQSVPSLANSAESEIELDIEEVPNSALLKLLQFVKKWAGPLPDEPETKVETSYHATTAPAAGKSKKSKPMSKHEQEAQIAELQGKLGSFAGDPVSPNALPSIENDSSDDDSEQESEEE